jgi:hypothetical protein
VRLSIVGIGDLTKIGVCYGESIFDAKFMNVCKEPWGLADVWYAKVLTEFLVIDVLGFIR